AEVIYAGKAAQDHALSQEEINALLVAEAGKGKTVARLKGGDPFVFGRGGEEAEALEAAGILFEVVPGVTAAVAVPAYAGIPVTHRDLTSSVAIVTGHEDPTKEESKIAWDKLATGAGTLVFLMGMQNLPAIVEKLLQHGRPASTPVALIRWGTRPRQATIVGTLDDIITRAQEAGFGPPAVAVIGEVVALRAKLRWFDNRPLFGKRVLVTRSRSQASGLSQLLSDAGAEPVEQPAIRIEPVSDEGLQRALSRLADYAWIIFTSPNGVGPFFKGLSRYGDSRQLKGVKVCALGPATAAAFSGYGIVADLIPQDYSSDGLLAALGPLNLKGARVLLPRAEVVPPELASGLAWLGATVEEVAVYRTVPVLEMDPKVKEMLLQGQVDIATFTSSSTVKGLMAMLKDEGAVLQKCLIACIGPETAKTAQELGLRVGVVAQEHTIPGLVKALAERYAAQGGINEAK
ncbi:MAG: uroporphyrinogen-III C-methyltransferase, partial [Chloroflexota bacterium]|nr:uroporphyrinogen-III C-methyltransferase [Chloroflexota bacterium]